jgi:hypothetical protein
MREHPAAEGCNTGFICAAENRYERAQRTRIKGGAYSILLRLILKTVQMEAQPNKRHFCESCMSNTKLGEGSRHICSRSGAQTRRRWQSGTTRVTVPTYPCVLSVSL